MGGFGSESPSRQRAKVRVEECVQIDVDDWLRSGYLDGDQARIVTMTWRANKQRYGRPGDHAEDVTVVAGFDPTQKRVLIAHNHLQQAKVSRIADVRLSQTTLAWGPSRWWLHCPHLSYSYGGYCAQRVRKLYLCPNSAYIGCRTCHNLTYQSCTESRLWDSAARQCFPCGTVSGNQVRQIMKHRAESARRQYESQARRELRRKRRKAKGWS